jgi:hypothetical protein
MAGLFGKPNTPTPGAPPPVPSSADPAIQARVNEAARLRSMGGRASTYLTNPHSQMDAEPSAARQLGAA